MTQSVTSTYLFGMVGELRDQNFQLLLLQSKMSCIKNQRKQILEWRTKLSKPDSSNEQNRTETINITETKQGYTNKGLKQYLFRLPGPHLISVQGGIHLAAPAVATLLVRHIAT